MAPSSPCPSTTELTRPQSPLAPPVAGRPARFARYVLPLFVWMAFIFVMSTRVGSSENTAPWVIRVVHGLTPGLLAKLTAEQIDFLNYLLRKAAHVCEYGILTVFAVRVFQQDWPGWRWRSGFAAVVLSLLYASSDEWHQKFVASRTATIIDVGVDAIGVTIALLFCWLWYRGNRSLSQELARLADLRDRGALTDGEFAAAKKRLLRG